MNADEIRRPSGEWVLLLDLTILDPDGWDRSDFNRSWTEPITRDEFINRARQSTLDGLRFQQLKDLGVIQ